MARYQGRAGNHHNRSEPPGQGDRCTFATAGGSCILIDMKKLALFLSVFLLLAPAAGAGTTPPPQKDEVETGIPPGAEALVWDRDFDLLLELTNEPTPAQLALESKRLAIEKERQVLVARRLDLSRRLESLQGSYTSETLLNEMLRLGVSDLQAVQKTLRDDLKRTDDRIQDLDFQLKRLKTPSGGG
jgi:hypothetical protein